MTDRYCLCGHAHRQHEIRSGGLFGCYLHGCLCIDFAEDGRCPECADGLVWDPRVHGNVVDCHHCDGTGEVVKSG